MLKKNITYVNAFGEEVVDTAWFNMTELEKTRFIAKYATGDEESLEGHITRISQEKDLKAIIALVEDIILTSYGVRSDDGKSFIKTKEVRESFEFSFAYAELFEQLIQNPEDMKQFVTSILTKQKAKAE